MKFLQTHRNGVFSLLLITIIAVAVVTGCGIKGGPSLLNLAPPSAGSGSSGGTPNLDGTANCTSGTSLTSCASVWTVFTPTM